MWFDGVRQPNTIYCAAVSRGKDSTAMLRAIQLLGWPLDVIASVDIWATDDIPAELPPMVEFKDTWDAKCFELFGVPVTRLCAMRKVPDSQIIKVEREREQHKSSDDEEWHSRKLTYEYQFYTPVQRGQHGGGGKSLKHYSQDGCNIYGFPVMARAWCNSRLKVSAMRESDIRKAFLQNSEAQRERREAIRIPASQGELVQCSQNQSSQTIWCCGELKQASMRNFFSDKPQERGAKINIVQYIGIAADEPKRIDRHINAPDKVLPLVQIGWDEDLCGLEATYMDMLSPTYDGSCRDGCWFCHNQGIPQLRNLRKNYPDLWALLMKWDLDSPVTFRADGHTVHDFDKRFQLEDDGYISPEDPWKWSYLEIPPSPQYSLF